ncbi:MAG: response regulator, partial [Mariprofundaceae bacterium]|nr:response regulator [Mariprofundaceae bacterium]
LSSINQALVALESGTLTDDGLVGLRRDAHTIKGSALMLGINDVGKIGHLFEDAVEHLIKDDALRNGYMIQLLFDMHDTLAERMQAVDSPAIDASPFQARYDALLTGEADSDAAAEHADSTKAEDGSAEHSDVVDVAAESDSPSENSTRPGHTDVAKDWIAMAGFRPDVSDVKAKVGRSGGSGRFMRVDAERLNVLSGQLIELSTGKAFGNKLSQEVQALQAQMRQLQYLARKLKSDAPASADVESSVLFDRQMEWLLRATSNLSSDVDYNVERQGLMLDDLRDRVLGLMLRPLESVFSAFPRAVRDVAGRYHKKARLVTAGESVECDQSVVESLMEPLVHLINNAVAHGIESPEERRALGKPEAGQISMLAMQSGSEIHIEVVDDGKGIDSEHIKRVAVERGVTTQFEADAMSEAEALELIFRPGFSTHEVVDETAGRGIGMNVVQDTVRRLTGVIRIQTQKGKGTRFLISLPVSIAVQRALMFRIGSQRFGMLIPMVEHVMAPCADELLIEGGKQVVQYDGESVPLVDLRHMLADKPDDVPDAAPLVLIARHIDGFTGIVVDELFDDAEIIVRELDPYLKRYQAQCLMGNTIAEDGAVVLLMEPYGIKEMGRTAPHQVVHDLAEGEANMHAVLALLAEDSIIARQIEKGLLESLGMTVDTAIDGMDAVEKMERGSYDVLITDLEMPRLDGFGLVRRVRNEPRYSELPILIISTRESAEDRMKGLEAGADAYLIKQNLAQGELHETLHSLLGPLTSADESNRKRPS